MVEEMSETRPVPRAMPSRVAPHLVRALRSGDVRGPGLEVLAAAGVPPGETVRDASFEPGTLFYTTRQETRVPWAMRDLARAAADLCQQQLKTGTIELRWFARCDVGTYRWCVDRGVLAWSKVKSDLCGLYLPRYPGTIWLSVHLPEDELFATVAHEARHLWQFECATVGVEDEEDDADRWERLVTRCYRLVRDASGRYRAVCRY